MENLGHRPRERDRESPAVDVDLAYTVEVGDAVELVGLDRLIHLDVDPAQSFGAQVGEAFDRDQPALSNDRDPIRYPLNFKEGVAAEEDRSTFGRDLTEELVELVLDERVEAGARLVHDHELRSIHQGLEKADLLAVAGAQVADLLAQIRGEALGQLVDEGPVDTAPEVCEKAQGVSTGEVGVEGEIARQVPDVTTDLDGVAARIETQDRRRAGGRPDLVENRPDHRCFPGAVGSQKPEHLPGADLQVQVDQSREVAVVLGQTAGQNRLVGHSRLAIAL